MSSTSPTWCAFCYKMYRAATLLAFLSNMYDHAMTKGCLVSSCFVLRPA